MRQRSRVYQQQRGSALCRWMGRPVRIERIQEPAADGAGHCKCNSRKLALDSLRGKSSNTDAIGAEVVAHFEDASQLQVITAGTGFCSQTDPRVHFGLGDERAPTRVEVRWPTGHSHELPAEALVPGRYHTIEEPDA